MTTPLEKARELVYDARQAPASEAVHQWLELHEALTQASGSPEALSLALDYARGHRLASMAIILPAELTRLLGHRAPQWSQAWAVLDQWLRLEPSEQTHWHSYYRSLRPRLYWYLVDSVADQVVARQHHFEHPEGSYIEGLWVPDDHERRPCCQGASDPLAHCRSIEHISNLRGVVSDDVRAQLKEFWKNESWT